MYSVCVCGGGGVSIFLTSKHFPDGWLYACAHMYNHVYCIIRVCSVCVWGWGWGEWAGSLIPDKSFPGQRRLAINAKVVGEWGQIT